MTALREAVRKAAVQAVWNAAHHCTCSTDTPARHCTPCNTCLDAIASAVLRAAVEGMTDAHLVQVHVAGERGGAPHGVAVNTMRAALLAALTGAGRGGI